MQRITSIIDKSLEEKSLCYMILKIWHSELFYNLDKHLVVEFSLLLKSYLSERCFRVKQEDTQLKDIKAVVPQGRVLGQMCCITVISQRQKQQRSTTFTVMLISNKKIQYITIMINI